MSYHDLTQAAILAEFNRRGEPVLYNGELLTGIFRRQDPERKNSLAATVTQAEVASLKMWRADVASPGYGDTVVIASQTWKVVQLLGGGGLHTCKLQIERDRRRAQR